MVLLVVVKKEKIDVPDLGVEKGTDQKLLVPP